MAARSLSRLGYVRRMAELARRPAEQAVWERELQGKLQSGLEVMTAFLPDAWIVDAIIALVAVEGIVLVAMPRANWRRPAGRGNPREPVVRRGPPVGPAHGASRAPRPLPSWPCCRLRSSLMSPISRADGKRGRGRRPRGLACYHRRMRSAGSRRSAESYEKFDGIRLVKAGVGRIDERRRRK